MYYFGLPSAPASCWEFEQWCERPVPFAAAVERRSVDERPEESEGTKPCLRRLSGTFDKEGIEHQELRRHQKGLRKKAKELYEKELST